MKRKTSPNLTKNVDRESKKSIFQASDRTLILLLMVPKI